jgi:hypothetical protein
MLIEVLSIIKLPKELVTMIYCTVFEDNQGAYLLATTQRITSRTKYFLVKFHHFWFYIELEAGNNRKINMIKCSTHEQGADILTKGQPCTTLENNIGIVGFLEMWRGLKMYLNMLWFK